MGDNALRGGRTALWATIGAILASRIDAHLLDLNEVELATVSVILAGLVGWAVNAFEDYKNSKLLVPKDRIAGDIALKANN